MQNLSAPPIENRGVFSSKDDIALSYDNIFYSLSWAAIFAGALSAISVSFILFWLGSGLGLAVLSPWPSFGASTFTFTITAALWLAMTQFVASAFGGYLAGRLRARYPMPNQAIPPDETYFRDTAHGMLSWSIATVFVAIIFAFTSGTFINTSAKTIEALNSENVFEQNDIISGTTRSLLKENHSYIIDNLLRTDINFNDTNTARDANIRTEVTKILTLTMIEGKISDADKAYVVKAVATHTGLPQDQASSRVEVAIAHTNELRKNVMKQEDNIRRSMMHTSIYMALSLLIGAFIASFAATMGGVHRDNL